MQDFFKNIKAKSALIICLIVICALIVALCAGQEKAADAEPAASERGPVGDVAQDAGKIRISEVMAKNKTTLQDEDGDFSDWIELENCSDGSVNLTGWQLSDKDEKPGWSFPSRSLEPGERIIVFASGKDRSEELHTSFALSAGETVSLRNAQGQTVSAVLCASDTADVSISWTGSEYIESLYPTPQRPNTAADYDAWQGEQSLAGPLVISEAMVSNYATWEHATLGYCDWLEIKNISAEAVDLSEYYLSDKNDNYKKWQFPNCSLDPGAYLIICCDDSGRAPEGGLVASFALDSTAESLYLSRADGALIDFVALRDIPYECSYGRIDGEGGGFFFSRPTPGEKNDIGYRRVSQAPIALTADGVFDGVNSVKLELSGSGTIYYTLDSSLPTTRSAVYTGAISLDKTCVVRAVCVDEAAMQSRALTLSYIINEGHSLPVLSLVSDNTSEFESMYSNGHKGMETPGSLSLYEQDGSFTIPCGIKMHGETSLVLPKKNMSVRFRGAYGQQMLSYDVYGGGVSEFTNFVLRSGQDFYAAIIRNELGQNLALASSDALITPRSKYCVLYIDGEYSGIYSLMEKANEQLYASVAGVSRESVTMEEATVQMNTELYEQVFDFCLRNDMSVDENYEQFCQVMDVDSLIDWIILESYCVNKDTMSGNLRYCRSSENDGKWRLMLYDLDSTFNEHEANYKALISAYAAQTSQVSALIYRLTDNEEFVDRLLKRAGELLNTELSNEAALAEIDRLAAIIAPEVERDYLRFGMDEMKWQDNIGYLKDFITSVDWKQYNINSLCKLFELTDEEREYYFG